MKPIKITCIALLLFLVSNFVVAQVTRPYHNGAVWDITFVKIKYGMEPTYLTYIATVWKRLREHDKKEGFILSYKVLQTEAHGTSDWDLMLMTEYKNLAALEAFQAISDSLAQKLVGNDQTQNQARKDRLEIREITGGRLAREIVLEPKR